MTLRVIPVVARMDYGPWSVLLSRFHANSRTPSPHLHAPCTPAVLGGACSPISPKGASSTRRVPKWSLDATEGGAGALHIHAGFRFRYVRHSPCLAPEALIRSAPTPRVQVVHPAGSPTRS